MKKSILIAVVVYCSICVVVFAACCKKKCNDASNPECENYDPCIGKVPNAGFIMRNTYWDDINERFYETSPLVEYGDTIYTESNGETDFIPNYKGNSTTKYFWKIDGMSTVFTKKELPSVNFGSYLSSNPIPEDSFFYKPLGVTLTVVEPKSECNIQDTIYKVKKYLTFTKGFMWQGWYKGSFSTDPTKEVEIFMGEMLDLIPPYNYYPTLYTNFPYSKDTIFWTGDNSIRLSSLNDVINYKQFGMFFKFITDYDSTTGGISQIVFKGKYDAVEKKNKVRFEYLFTDKTTKKTQTIIFNGTQLKFFKFKV